MVRPVDAIRLDNCDVILLNDGHQLLDVTASTGRSRSFPIGDALEVYVRREDAERVIEEVQADEPELAAFLRIEERELEAGGWN